MRRILFALLTLLPLSLLAQESTFREMRRDISTRGMEFSIKAIGSPGGYHDAYNASGYVCGGFGGEAILSYRINKCFSVGLGATVTRGWFGKDASAWMNDYGWKMCGITSFIVNFKVNIKEKEKFSPYVSISYGVDWLDMLDAGDTLSANPRAIYGRNSFSMVLIPAGGLDFPLQRGAAFVEARFDYRITDLYLPSFAVGYTF